MFKTQLVMAGALGLAFLAFSHHMTSPADAKSLRADVEALHTAPLLFNLVLQLKPHRHFAPTAFDDLVTLLDRYIQIRSGTIHLRKTDPGYAMSDTVRQKAYALRDQATLALVEFMQAVQQHADPVPTVRIERICVAIREQIEMVWRENISNGRLLFN
jgi:hypothetical protein